MAPRNWPSCALEVVLGNLKIVMVITKGLKTGRHFARREYLRCSRAKQSMYGNSGVGHGLDAGGVVCWITVSHSHIEWEQRCRSAWLMGNA